MFSGRRKPNQEVFKTAHTIDEDHEKEINNISRLLRRTQNIDLVLDSISSSQVHSIKKNREADQLLNLTHKVLKVISKKGLVAIANIAD